jgi:tRNA(fMet)-specific endonuclease VapC
MIARYLLDTNTCIYIHRRKPPEVLARFRRLRAGEAVVSVVTYGELLFGAEKSVSRAKVVQIIEEFTSIVHVLPLSGEAARLYGAIRAVLSVRGEMIGANDLWIAAHARALDLTLVTNNERAFKRVTGLKIQNWIG